MKKKSLLLLFTVGSIFGNVSTSKAAFTIENKNSVPVTVWVNLDDFTCTEPPSMALGKYKVYNKSNILLTDITAMIAVKKLKTVCLVAQGATGYKKITGVHASNSGCTVTITNAGFGRGINVSTSGC